MAKKQSKNKKKSSPPSPDKSVSSKSGLGVQKSLKERNPVLRFVLLFALLMALFYLFWMTDFFKAYIFTPVAEMNAMLANVILNIFGMGTTRIDDVVSSGSFSISIKRGCDALEPIALYSSAILAFPLAFSRKWKGLLFGGLFLLVLNLLRVVTLFLTGVYYPSIFDAMHEDIWQVIFILMAIVCWIVWIQFETKNLKANVQQ